MGENRWDCEGIHLAALFSAAEFHGLEAAGFLSFVETLPPFAPPDAGSTFHSSAADPPPTPWQSTPAAKPIGKNVT